MNNWVEIRDEVNVKNQEVPRGAPISCGRAPEPITVCHANPWGQCSKQSPCPSMLPKSHQYLICNLGPVKNSWQLLSLARIISRNSPDTFDRRQRLKRWLLVTYITNMHLYKRVQKSRCVFYKTFDTELFIAILTYLYNTRSWIMYLKNLAYIFQDLDFLLKIFAYVTEVLDWRILIYWFIYLKILTFFQMLDITQELDYSLNILTYVSQNRSLFNSRAWCK